MQKRTQQYIDEAEIRKVVHTERTARDQMLWDRMLASFHPGAVVDVSWFHGRSIEFVEASRRMAEAGRHSAHQLGYTLVTLNGDRALAETPCVVCSRTKLDGVEVELSAHGRLHERLERCEAGWRIARMNMVYLRDQLTAVNPDSRPSIHSELLSSYRPSYRFLSYVLAHFGEKPRDDLPGTDRPETVQPLLDRDNAWLVYGK